MQAIVVGRAGAGRLGLVSFLGISKSNGGRVRRESWRAIRARGAGEVFRGV